MLICRIKRQTRGSSILHYLRREEQGLTPLSILGIIDIVDIMTGLLRSKISICVRDKLGKICLSEVEILCTDGQSIPIKCLQTPTVNFLMSICFLLSWLKVCGVVALNF